MAVSAAISPASASPASSAAATRVRVGVSSKVSRRVSVIQWLRIGRVTRGCVVRAGRRAEVFAVDGFGSLSDPVGLGELERLFLSAEYVDDGVHDCRVDLGHWFPGRVEPPEEEGGPLLSQLEGQVGKVGVGAEDDPVVDPEGRVLALGFLLHLGVARLLEVLVAWERNI